LPGRTPEKNAQQLLSDAWSTDDGGIVVVPVDPVQIARSLGIDVRTAHMKEDFSGALEKGPGDDPVIYLNERDSQNRQRFSCAHELGHYYLRTLEGQVSYSFVDRRERMARTGTDPDEIYANQFGAALIMPADAVKRLSRRFNPVQLAYRFRVSEEAMRFRLGNLGLL